MKAVVGIGLTLVSGLLVHLSFAPYALPLGWLALVPWLWALEGATSRKTALALGFAMSFCFTFAIQYWVPYALHESGGVPWAVGVSGALGYWVIGHPEFYTFVPLFWAVRRFAPGPLSRVVISALLFASVDWAVPKLYNEGIGHAAHAMARLRQLAALGGVPLLTFVFMLVSFTLVELLRWRGQKPRPAFWRGPAASLAVSLVACVAALIYGELRLSSLNAELASPPRALRAAVVQGNIPNELRLAADMSEPGAITKILNHYVQLTRRAAQGQPAPELIVWPESAYPSRFHTPDSEEGNRTDDALTGLIEQLGIPLLFGAPSFERGLQYNSLFLALPGHSTTSALQLYRKSRLVPFGEYIPATEQLPWLKAVFPQIINLGAGPGPELLSLPGVTLVPAICYEILFPAHAAEGARRGASLIMNLTNDSWFGRTTAPHVHLALSIFRSIETRLPQLRATNTGITTLILPTGEQQNTSGLFEEQVLAYNIPLLGASGSEGNPAPLAVRWGEWFGWCSGLAALAALAVLAGLRRYRPSLRS